MNLHEMQIGNWRAPFSSFRAASSKVFSGEVENSPRLRLLGLATFWLVAIAVAWVGGSPWTWLGGGIAASLGHAFSWHRRQRSLGAWTAVIALMVMGLAVLMRVEILAVFEGNWLPLAHFLLLVQAISSFDVRTRGGLYAGLAMSGIVLFFASQQAFELSFGIFLSGYTALVITFLATTLVEDESQGAKVLKTSRGVPVFGFWSAMAAVVLLVSVFAFLLLPRGESNAVGYQQVSALPITGDPNASQTPPSVLPSTPTEGSGASSDPGLSDDLEPLDSGQPTGGGKSTNTAAGSWEPISSEGSALNSDAFAEIVSSIDEDDVVMHVRSPVASYWRGQVFHSFDGRRWYAKDNLAQVPGTRYIPDHLLKYTQTFFVHEPHPGATFMGYRGVDVLSPDDELYQKSLGRDSSYKVQSVQPGFTPRSLRKDRLGKPNDQYYSLPTSMEGLKGFVDQITAGKQSGFDRAAAIVEYLQRNGQFDESASNQLSYQTNLSDLVEGTPGTSMDFATSTVMMARAAGLPARLAVGYLPGERDPLSGAYSVRGRDAHAWAEIQFQKHGWVPFDGAPRPDLVAGGSTAGGQLAGLKYLFENSVGDDMIRAAVIAPAKLSSALKDSFTSPVSMAIATSVTIAILSVLGWLGIRFMWSKRNSAETRWSYERLQGEQRKEILRVYKQVERLLKKRGIEPRKAGQTLGEYARMAVEQKEAIEDHLLWFTKAAWTAAYNPGWKFTSLDEHRIEEAKIRLKLLKAHLA